MQPAKAPCTSTRAHHTQPARILRAAAQQQYKESAGLVRASLKSTRVSSPNDPEEKEADRTADNVMRMRLADHQIHSTTQGASQVFRFSDAGDPSRQIRAGMIARQHSTQDQEEILQRQADKEQELQRQSTEQEETLHLQPISRQPSEQQIFTRAAAGHRLGSDLQSEIDAATGEGEPLPLSIRRYMEPRFNANFSAIRIHRERRSASLNKRLSAQAFAYRNHIFFGDNQYQPDSDSGKHLIAHELTHSIQQGAAKQQPPAKSISAPKSSSNARHTPASSLQRTVEVIHRSDDQVQRLGVSDALNYFAERAHHIPGYRLLTLLLGINPINRSPVERHAINLLRAMVEFLPGGYLITQALENHGLITRTAEWVDARLSSLGMTAVAIRAAIMSFLDSLSWSDIFDLNGVWQRARRLFTEPIGRILRFARGLVSSILSFIKQALLMPLARLAARTRGWNLLCAVLGRNPISGEPVERNAENLIGGFMHLIGQQEVWENIQRANAIPRAWAWLQGALTGLFGFVHALPAQILTALNALGIADLISLPGIFVQLARYFTRSVSVLVRWAANQVMGLLQIIFQVVAPGLMPLLRRARGALRSIIRDPIGFVRNLARAGSLGFRQFSANILNHLRAALLNWMTNILAGSGIYIPQSFSLRELIKFVLSVLGVTWQSIRRKLVRAVGETAVVAMERGFDLVKTLIIEGPTALWQAITQSIGNLRQLVLEKIMNFVAVRVVQAAVVRLVSMINPAGAFVQAILATYNTILFFVDRLRTLARFARSILSSLITIAAGRIRPAATRIERAMAGTLTLVIDFLARLLGLGNLSRAISNLINRIRQPINRALNRAVSWIVAQARKLGRFAAQAGAPHDPKQRLIQGLNTAKTVVARLPRNRLSEMVIRQALRLIKTRYGFEVLEPKIRNQRWWIAGKINPEGEIDTGVATNNANPTQAAQSLPDQIDILDSSNSVQIQNYSRSHRQGDLMAGLFSGSQIRLDRVRYQHDGGEKVQPLGPGVRIRYSISDANRDYVPPTRIAGIVDSNNPEEAATYQGHRHAFERVKRRWWRDLDSGDAKLQRLIDRGWVLSGNKRGLQGGTTKWRYIYSLFNDNEKRHYGNREKKKSEMLGVFERSPEHYRINEFIRRWGDRIGEQTEIHHLLPLDFGGSNQQTFIPLSRDMHTKNTNSVHLVFWNPLKRWLVGLRTSGQ